MTPAPRRLGLEVFAMSVRALRANWMRSMLTTLGVVVGVATVVAMTSIIQGFNRTVESAFTSFGSHVIYMRKSNIGSAFSPEFVDSMARTPAFTTDDAEAIRELCPDVASVTIFAFAPSITVSYRGRSTRGVQTLGVDPHVQEVNAYDPGEGRFFTAEETERGAQVVVLGKNVREALMTGEDPIGKTVHLNGIPFRVVGELAPKGRSLFTSPDDLINIPYTTLTKYFPPGPDAPFFIPKVGQYYLNAIAVSPERTSAAIDQITELLRRRRGLRSNRPLNFAIFTEESFTKVFHQLTGATFIVMILISSIALVVGGIGVMNIMLVAVTERTREIGLRKALGAPRGTILQQFLFEAILLTTLGGAIGIAAGAGVAQLVRAASGLPAYTPVWVVVVAVLFSTTVGLFFGIYPALRASRLDPVEALRWE
jgi:putative ABC transport system permease protein